jgi:hypothetical protein
MAKSKALIAAELKIAALEARIAAGHILMHALKAEFVAYRNEVNAPRVSKMPGVKHWVRGDGTQMVTEQHGRYKVSRPVAQVLAS